MLFRERSRMSHVQSNNVDKPDSSQGLDDPDGPAVATAPGTTGSVLVIGTGHEYQRHQDNYPAYQAVREQFDNYLRKIAAERTINLIAEEAGDDKEVWTALKKDEKKTLEDWGV